MSDFFNTFRSFFGLPTVGEPKNEFRNPIWGSDDDEDEDDELYHTPSSPNRDVNIHIYSDGMDLNKIMTRQMQDMLGMFNGMFGEMRSMLEDVGPDQFVSVMDITPDLPLEGSLRDHYLKPGYNAKQGLKEDVDLDGKISSHEIAGLLKQKNFKEPSEEFSCNEFSSKEQFPTRGSFFQTIITQSVTKPDGSVETRRIVKDHLGNVEETVTTSQRDGPHHEDDQRIAEPYQHANVFKDFSTFWKIF